MVGKPIGTYIRERRLAKAADMLASTDQTITSIGFACGFNSSQSFSRAFKNSYGISPKAYRSMGYTPVTMSVEEVMDKFSQKLRGGMFVHPKLIKRGELLIAGIKGDGSKTAQLWQEFIRLYRQIGFKNKLSDNSYEIRIYDGSCCTCHVGVAVADTEIDGVFSLMKLPASIYASFEVYVARGYDSENEAMDEWLEANRERYTQRKCDGKPYVVEFYDERFDGDSENSIVEIWVPIEKTRSRE